MDPRLLVIVVAVALLGSSCSGEVVNEAVDELLEALRFALRAKGTNKIPLNDINKDFKAKIFGVEVPGKFSARGGYIEDLATLHRTGDVVLDTQGQTLNLKVSFGFDLLHAFYSDYDFNFLTVVSKGTMEVSATQTSASLAISVIRDGDKCVVRADSASIDTLGQLKTNFSGPGDLNKIATVLLNWILENFKDIIQTIVNAKVKEAAAEGLTKVDLCKKLPH